MSTTTSIPSQLGPFNLVADVPLHYADSRVVKWTSNATGLSVVWCDVEGPLVNGYFVTRTEIFDDSGRPHTLEHLIFMGSEKYPYKGVLDTLANRMFANGTNAWTDIHNTTYTVGTAGEEGFLGILPVYLDHVLYPTLTESAFVTEAHHINDNGEDSGVVFGEMQGRENGSGDLMALRLQRTLYNEKNAFRSETGGLMEALRVLTVEQIREYHAGSYVPQNMTLVVTGRSLSPTKLLQTLIDKVEPSIAAHGQAKGTHPDGWLRPFVESSTAKNPASIPNESNNSDGITDTVEFPEKDESVGELQVAWITYSQSDFLTALAISTLCDYLTDGVVSPLYKEFVEIDEPLCTDIQFNASSEEPSILSAYLSSVPSESLQSLGPKFKDALRRIANEEQEPIDMERMATALKRQKLKLLDQLETDAADVLCTSIITDTLFGPEDGSEISPMFDIADYDRLAKWDSKQWSDLLVKYYVNNPSVTLIGRPSAALAHKIEQADKARVAETVKRLGPEGLKAMAKKVEQAQAENDKPIPDEIIKEFSVPDVNKIDWINVLSARSAGLASALQQPHSALTNKAQEHVDQDGAELPILVQFDHIESNFISISVFLFVDPSTPKSLKSLIPLYIDSFFSLPVTRADGTSLPYEEVVRLLDSETLSYSIDIAYPMQEGLTVTMKVPKEDYSLAVAWLRDLLVGSQFSIDRLKITATKALQNLPSEKRSGSAVGYAAYRQLVMSPESTNASMNLLNRSDSIPEVIERLKSDPESVVRDLDTLRSSLVHPGSLRVSVKGNILTMDKPSSTWKKRFAPFPTDKGSELTPVQLAKDALSPLGQSPSKKIVVVGVSSIESSFAYHAAKGPDSYTHPDQPALTVARSIVNAMEGFLWKFIRGAGLAYGANIDQDVEAGFVYYRVFKSPDAYAAFAAAKDLIDGLGSGKIVIDELTLESAKSSLAFNTAAREATKADAAAASFNNQVLRGLPQSFGRDALAKTKDVTVAQVQEVIKKWLVPIFDPKLSIGGVSTGLAKMDSIVERYEKAGYDVETRLLKGTDDDDEEEEEEDGSEDGSEEDEDGSGKEDEEGMDVDGESEKRKLD